MASNKNKENNYSASDISVLEGLEPVRKRPGMYVGDTSKAIKQMVFEAIDNCIDEHLMGYCANIYFEYKDGYFTVRDDGRGIPVDLHKNGKPALEVILSTLHAGGKFGNGGYEYSGGLHGVGISVVVALSKIFEAEVYRNNTVYYIKFEDGLLTVPMEERGPTELKGTQIRFLPDVEFIQSEIPTSQELTDRLKELSFLNPGLKIHYKFNEEKEEFFSVGGITELTKTLGKSILENIIHYSSEQVTASFFWDDNENEHMLCFTNNIFQIDGGTHLFGFRSALAKVILPYAEKEISNGKHKAKKVLAEDVKGGLKGVLSIKIKEPKFSSQTKNKLVSIEAKSLVEGFIIEQFSNFMEQNPKEREKIVKRVIFAAYIRETVSNSKDSMKKANIDPFSVLPGKLSDCQSDDPEECELFIVEGDSAGGPAKAARNKKNQAVLCLKGKPLNTERATLNKALSCESIVTIIAALGTGVGKNFDINKLRYKKIIIMTDADVDGLHIRCLLITLFLKLMPDVVENGNVFVARTPLYKVTSGKTSKYIQDDAELEVFILDRFTKNHRIETNGNNLSSDQIKELIKECEDFRSFVNGKVLTVDPQLFSLALCHNAFQSTANFEKYLAETVDAEIKTNITDRGIDLKLTSIYGVNEFFIKNFGVNWTMKMFPVFLDGEKIYEPLAFLKAFEKKTREGLDIQRYKGLGEMNDDELEISINPKTRILDQLHITTTIEDAIAEMQEVMGNENDRRSFVLGYLQEIFGIYKEINLVVS